MPSKPRIVEPTLDSDLAVARTPATSLLEFRNRLEAVRRLLGAKGRFKLSHGRIGAPGTEEAIGDAIDAASAEENSSAVPPFGYKPIHCAFDGCRLSWSLRRGRQKALRGQIHIASLKEICSGDLAGLYEGGRGTQLFPSTERASVELIEDEEELSIFGREDGYFRGGGIEVLDALNRCVDLLGLDGWELVLFEELLDDDADVPDAVAACEAAAADLWATLGGPPAVPKV